MNTKVTPSSVPNEKTTIYLDPRIKKSVQYFALRDNSSLSHIINEKLIEYLEDQADIAALNQAREESSEFVAFEEVVKSLGLDIDEIRHQAETERSQTA